MAEKTRILVIEDDRAIQAVIRAVLEKAGYQVLVAADAHQGTTMARTLRPHLIVLDIVMPAGGGFVAFSRLRQLAGTVTIPVLVYSTMPRDQILEKIQTGPDVQVLQKPAPAETLLGALGRLLARNQR